MAAVEETHRQFLLVDGAFAVFPFLARQLADQGLHRRGGDRTEQLGQVGAALHATDALLDLLAKAGGNAQADEFLGHRRDPAAVVVGRCIDAGRGIDDVHFQVDGDAQADVVQCFAGADDAAAILVGKVESLGVHQSALDIDQAVVASIAIAFDAAMVHGLAGFGAGQGHGRYSESGAHILMFFHAVCKAFAASVLRIGQVSLHRREHRRYNRNESIDSPVPRDQQSVGSVLSTARQQGRGL